MYLKIVFPPLLQQFWSVWNDCTHMSLVFGDDLIDETLMNIISGFQERKKNTNVCNMTLHILQTELNKITEGYKLIISSKSFQVTEISLIWSC